ncbi:DUF6677 family protein [Halobacteriales archaeon Cl-PHB]
MSATTTAADGSSKRPWIAALLAFVYPGLGHVYLRKWIRAMLWFGLVVTTSTLLIPEAAVPSSISVDALIEAGRSIPLEATLTILSISFLSVADAYWLAAQSNRQAAVAAAQTCPNCGKELDEDIDFCHWCTTRIERPAEEETEASSS